MFAARFLIRSRRTHQAVRVDSKKRAVIFGAGSGGRILVQSLVRDPASGIVPVALLDDDHRKSRLHFSGVRVRGTRHDLATVAEQRRATTLVIAVPSATSETVRELSALARDCGLDVLVLPPVSELFDGRPSASDLRNLDVADLLGRQPVDLDMGAIADQISGKRVLVTGAGGSIGSELCRQIAKFGPSKLLMLDRDESGLHATQLSIDGRPCSTPTTCCCATSATSTPCRRPSTAAAPRSSSTPPRSSTSPCSSATRRRRSRPTSSAPATCSRRPAPSGSRPSSTSPPTRRPAPPACSAGRKRVAERLTASFDTKGCGRYISVRFGNVLGSRGSVVPAFLEQIHQGGPITVTHPDVERYFMVIPEACQLVLQAGAMGRGGEVMVLDMGSPVKIVQVAQHPDRPVGPYRHRDRLHRPAAGREAHRGALHPRRGGHPPLPTRSSRRCTCRSSTPARSTCTRRARGRRGPRVDAPPRQRRAVEHRLMSDRIHLSKPDITELEERLVVEALRSGWVAPSARWSTASRPRSPSVWAWPARWRCPRAPQPSTLPCSTWAPRPDGSSSSPR